MSLKEYFEKGRTQEQERAQKQEKMRTRQMSSVRNRKQEMPWYHPGAILVGAGVLYEVLTPLWAFVAKGFEFVHVYIAPTLLVIRGDIQNLIRKVRGMESREWHDYRAFCELARGKR